MKYKILTILSSLFILGFSSASFATGMLCTGPINLITAKGAVVGTVSASLDSSSPNLLNITITGTNGYVISSSNIQAGLADPNNVSKLFYLNKDGHPLANKFPLVNSIQSGADNTQVTYKFNGPVWMNQEIYLGVRAVMKLADTSNSDVIAWTDGIPFMKIHGSNDKSKGSYADCTVHYANPVAVDDNYTIYLGDAFKKQHIAVRDSTDASGNVGIPQYTLIANDSLGSSGEIQSIVLDEVLVFEPGTPITGSIDPNVLNLQNVLPNGSYELVYNALNNTQSNFGFSTFFGGGFYGINSGVTDFAAVQFKYHLVDMNGVSSNTATVTIRLERRIALAFDMSWSDNISATYIAALQASQGGSISFPFTTTVLPFGNTTLSINANLNIQGTSSNISLGQFTMNLGSSSPSITANTGAQIFNNGGSLATNSAELQVSGTASFAPVVIISGTVTNGGGTQPTTFLTTAYDLRDGCPINTFYSFNAIANKSGCCPLGTSINSLGQCT